MKTTKKKIAKYHLSLAGEYRVASELLKRGLNATVTFGNAKSADVVAYGPNRRAAIIEVKTSQQKKMVTQFYNRYKSPDEEHPDFWVIVKVEQDQGVYRERFFVLTHVELAAAQAERDREWLTRRGLIEPDEKLTWERFHELVAGVPAVNNVYVHSVESHEDRWDKIVAFCESEEE